MNGCCHDKECYECKENKKDKLEKILYLFSIIVFVLTFIVKLPQSLKIGMYIITILLAGYEIILDGIKNIFKLNFEEDTLMTIAVISACILGEFVEGCLVILLFGLGEIIESKAVDKSNESIKKIVDIKSKNANIVYNDEIKVVDVKEINVGDKILVKPGEMVPVDCRVVSGSSNIDTSRITGESKPMYVEEDSKLLSGEINLDGSLTCVAEKTFENSTASQIVDLVYEAQNNKGKTEEFITKFSKIYTPVVIVLAILIAIIPTLIGLDVKTWINRALVFLVASCPCSIVISVPLALFTCIGAISKKGMLIKGTKHIEDLSKAKIIAFDKTGTLTTGKMEIDKIETKEGYTKEEVLEYIYNLEKNSSHPIASSIQKKVEELNMKVNHMEVESYKEIAGCGIYGIIDKKDALFGNKKLLDKYGIKYENIDENKNYVVVDGKIIGSVTLKEEVRSGVDVLVKKLKDIGIEKAVILTGDNKKGAEKIASKIKVDLVYAGLLPNEKLEKINLLKEQGKTIFVGDGINDSPVLAASDFSISMGEGTEIANNVADSILISNNLNIVPDIIKISRKTMHILKTNITFSILVKILVLIAGIMGVAPIWLAVFADVGVTLITILNSIRSY